jgi:hypothetical protein
MQVLFAESRPPQRTNVRMRVPVREAHGTLRSATPHAGSAAPAAAKGAAANSAISSIDARRCGRRPCAPIARAAAPAALGVGGPELAVRVRRRAKWDRAKWDGAKWDGAKWDGAKWDGS